MASEHHPHSGTTSSGQRDATALDNTICACDLAANSDLHVVYEEGSGLAITQICHLHRDEQIACVLHGVRVSEGQTGTRAEAVS